jgi:glucose 1-dehydrogenase
MRLRDKVAIVTGGNSGIGRAIAWAFAAEGATVVIGARDHERGQAVVREIEAGGGRALFVETHVERVADCQNLARRTLATFGAIDVLVNNAAVFWQRPTTEVDEAFWDQQIAINLKGPFFCGQAVLPHMVERRQGKIINVTSIAAILGFPGSSVYCASKGGLHTLTKAWALEYAPLGINVNTLAPGNIETPMNAAIMANPEWKQAMISNTPAGRNGQVDDIAPAAVFLASDEARFMHGACLLVDGGWAAR